MHIKIISNKCIKKCFNYYLNKYVIIYYITSMEEVNEIKQRKHAEFADYREYKLKTKYDLKYYHENWEIKNCKSRIKKLTNFKHEKVGYQFEDIYDSNYRI